MEITQFTYFQEVGGLDCKPVLGEITYGLERLAMYLQGKENVYDLVWTPGVTYGDVYHQNEVEQSRYNFELSNAEMLFRHFGEFEAEAKRLIEAQCVLPAYEMVLKCSHTFNLLDARGAISVTERAAYIGRVRTLARAVAQAYYESRERLGFPMVQGEVDGSHAARRAAHRGAAAEVAASSCATAFADACSTSWRSDGFLPRDASDSRVFATPRRLAVLHSERARALAPTAIARRSQGPPVKAAAAQAVAGFAKKHGVAVEALEAAQRRQGRGLRRARIVQGRGARRRPRAARSKRR